MKNAIGLRYVAFALLATSSLSACAPPGTAKSGLFAQNGVSETPALPMTIVIAGTGTSGTATGTGSSNTTPAPASAYSLAFADEFNPTATGAPNPQYWDYGVDAQINNEEQCYTERRENVRVENRVIDGRQNGVLVLQARRESHACPYAGNRTFSFTSGALTTRTKGWGPIKVDMSFGRYEIRAKIPKGRGTWPAIWLLGESSLGSWPKSGEIDIMEAVGYDEAQGRNRFYSTIHKDTGGGGAWPVQTNTSGMGHIIEMNEPPSQNFHVFALDWTPTSITFYVDGRVVGMRTMMWDQPGQWFDSITRSQAAPQWTPISWPFARETPGHQFYMILNLAWGGGWGGAAGTDPSIFDQGPVEMLVDYVRVYRKN